jgi:hypothetical protein
VDQPELARLQEAWQWIQLGHQDHAANLLTVLLTSEPDSVEAWWLLAVASSDSAARRRALRNVLRLRPDDARALRMLHGLGARPATQEMRPISFSQPIFRAGGQAPPLFHDASIAYFPARLPPLRRRVPKPRDPWRRPRWAVYAVIFAAAAGLVGCGLLLCTMMLTGWSLNNRALGGLLPAATVTVRPNAMALSLRGGLKYSAWRDGRLDAPGQLDGYNFSGRYGDQVVAQVSALEPMTLQPILGLYGREQSLLTSSAAPDVDAVIRLAYALPYDGEFVIVVAGQSSTIGSYRLMLRRMG